MDVRLTAEQKQLRDAAAKLADDLGPGAVSDLADDERIARLDNLQMRLLHEHLPGPNTDDATPDGWDGWDYVSTSSSPQPGRFGEFTVIAHPRQNG